MELKERVTSMEIFINPNTEEIPLVLYELVKGGLNPELDIIRVYGNEQLLEQIRTVCEGLQIPYQPSFM